jgi:hypothetical protein
MTVPRRQRTEDYIIDEKIKAKKEVEESRMRSSRFTRKIDKSTQETGRRLRVGDRERARGQTRACMRK